MNPKFTKHTLDNGLQIFFYNDSNKHATSFHLVVKFGGINGDFILDGKEYHLSNGMAHLLEHLLLEHSQYGDLSSKLEKMNMTSNGVTNISKTEFYFNTVDKLTEGIEIMVKGINEPYFTKDDLETTKPAIYEEIRIGNDNKYKVLFNLRNTQMFKKIPYIDTAGKVEEIKNVDYDLVTKTYQAFYQPNNQMILVAGKFNETEVLNQIQDLYRQLPKRNQQVEIIQYNEPKQINQKYAKKKFNTGEDIVAITYKIDIKDLTPLQKLELDFYLSYFGEMNTSVTSPLYRDLSDNSIITDGLACSYIGYKDVITFYIEAYVKDERQFIDKVTENMKKPVFDENLFYLYQKESKVQIAIRPENLDHIIGPLIENLTLFDCPNIDTVEQIDQYNFERFKRMINNLDFSNYVITKIEK